MLDILAFGLLGSTNRLEVNLFVGDKRNDDILVVGDLLLLSFLFLGDLMSLLLSSVFLLSTDSEELIDSSVGRDLGIMTFKPVPAGASFCSSAVF
jgi:hypothetical protein